MPTLYVTPEEYAVLGEERVRAIKAAGEDVVVVEDDATAEKASWAQLSGQASPKDHVPDVQVSFMPASGQGANTPQQEPGEAKPALEDRHVALLEELVEVQRANLAETRALRTALEERLAPPPIEQADDRIAFEPPAPLKGATAVEATAGNVNPTEVFLELGGGTDTLSGFVTGGPGKDVLNIPPEFSQGLSGGDAVNLTFESASEFVRTINEQNAQTDVVQGEDLEAALKALIDDLDDKIAEFRGDAGAKND